MSFKITIRLLDDHLKFSPKKYFVSKHSIYPSIVNFEIPEEFNANLFFERLIEKFPDFEKVGDYSVNDSELNCNKFILIHENKENSIIFEYSGYEFKYYSSFPDEGLIYIIDEIIKSCNETKN